MYSNTLGLIFMHMVTLSHLVKTKIVGLKAPNGHLKERTTSRATCRELKSYLFKALVLPTSTYGTEIWRGDMKNYHWKVFEKGMKMHMMSHVKVCSSISYHTLLAEFGKVPIELYALKLTTGFQQWLAHPFPCWLISKATSFSWHLAEQGFDTQHKSTTMWKTSWGLSH